VANLLIVDDEKNMRTAVRRLFAIEGHQVLEAADGQEAIDRLDSDDIDLVILDLEMPRVNGFAVLDRMRERGDRTPVIILTGHGSIDRAVQAVRRGAGDFLEKPPDPERLMVAARNALRIGALDRENRELRDALQGEVALIGTGPATVALRGEIARAVATDSPVLIGGENGTGKEVVARLIHAGSARRDGPFVAVNCAALPAELFESELFGAERGAFTGAARRRTGRFERAAGGTLFLDEIGDIPTALQAKLLRAIESRNIERLGGEVPIAVDARVIAATNRDLRAALASGDFRADLYYRIAVLPIEVPPLRARREDVPALVDHFLRQGRAQRPSIVRRFAPEAIAALSAHDFPGNVRELRNLVERLTLIAAGEVVTAADVRAVLPVPLTTTAAPAPTTGPPAGGSAVPETLPTYKESLREAERTILLAALERHRWQMARTARALGIERSHLYRKIKGLGIRVPD